MAQRPNAMSIYRRIGGRALPFTVRVETHPTFVRVQCAPLDLATAWQLLCPWAREQVVLHDLSCLRVDHEDGALHTARAVRDAGGAGPDVVDAICLPRAEVGMVLDRLVHEELSLIDHGLPLDEEGVLGLYLETHLGTGDSVLDGVPEASMAAHVHRDAFFTADLRSAEVADALICHALGVLAWTHTGQQQPEPEPLPLPLLWPLFGASRCFSLLLDHARVDGQGLVAPLSRRPPPEASEPLRPIEQWLCWQAETGWWVEDG